MHAQARFRLNTPNVIAEVIDGEAILVDLRTGNYFSVQGSGSVLFEAITRGASVGAISARVADDLRLDRQTAEDAVGSFCADLEREGLIVAFDGEPTRPEPELDLRMNGTSFSPPVVEKYTDMQDLVLLDPVHEVDERGWPHAQP